jgi:hypothetical protein
MASDGRKGALTGHGRRRAHTKLAVEAAKTAMVHAGTQAEIPSRSHSKAKSTSPSKVKPTEAAADNTWGTGDNTWGTTDNTWGTTDNTWGTTDNTWGAGDNTWNSAAADDNTNQQSGWNNTDVTSSVVSPSIFGEFTANWDTDNDDPKDTKNANETSNMPNPHGFTKEQDEKLMELKTKKQGMAWVKVAEDVGMKDHQCKERFKQLQAAMKAADGGGGDGGAKDKGKQQDKGSNKKDADKKSGVPANKNDKPVGSYNFGASDGGFGNASVKDSDKGSAQFSQMEYNQMRKYLYDQQKRQTQKPATVPDPNPLTFKQATRGSATQSTKFAPSVVTSSIAAKRYVVVPDKTFSEADLKVLGKILKRSNGETWNRVSDQFYDKTDRRIDPDVFEYKFTGHVLREDLQKQEDKEREDQRKEQEKRRAKEREERRDRDAKMKAARKRMDEEKEEEARKEMERQRERDVQEALKQKKEREKKELLKKIEKEDMEKLRKQIEKEEEVKMRKELEEKAENEKREIIRKERGIDRRESRVREALRKERHIDARKSESAWYTGIEHDEEWREHWQRKLLRDPELRIAYEMEKERQEIIEMEKQKAREEKEERKRVYDLEKQRRKEWERKMQEEKDGEMERRARLARKAHFGC